MTEKTNALGQPSPNRTDFKDWSRESLEAFARQAADENLVLQANVAALLQQWRDVTIAVAEEREAVHLERGTLLYNPYTGYQRHAADVAVDPHGILLVNPYAPLKAAP